MGAVARMKAEIKSLKKQVASLERECHTRKHHEGELEITIQNRDQEITRQKGRVEAHLEEARVLKTVQGKLLVIVQLVPLSLTSSMQISGRIYSRAAELFQFGNKF